MSSEIESLSTSYLFGERPYVEELYEAYLDNPGSVPDNWREYFDQLQHARHRRPGIHSRPGPCSHRRIVRSARQGQCLRATRRRTRPERRQQASLGAVPDRRLPFAGFALGRPRSAQAPGTSADPRARSRLLRPDRSRPGPDLLGHQHLLHDRQHHDAARHPEALRDTYCRSIGAEFTHISDPPPSAGSRNAWKPRWRADLHGRGKAPHPAAADRVRRPRALPAHQVRRPEALLAGRRRELHRLDGRSGEPRR